LFPSKKSEFIAPSAPAWLTAERPADILSKLQHAASGAMPTPDREGIVIGVESIIIMIVVGAIAGWLAGLIVRGFGFGLVWDILIGIVGAFIGVWLLTRLGIVPFSGFVGSIVNATIGAVVLLFIVGLIRRVA
jgi:uncharacterized membrane protein YeaQ/YmgE (transglycosylase-associated protein family)